MKEFVVAGIQIAVQPMQFEENLARLQEWLYRAAEEYGAELLILPESITTGFHPGTGARELWEVVEEIPGPATEMLAAVARDTGAYILYPSYERGPNRDTVYNSAALVGPEEGLLGCYRKTHLFPTERKEAGGWSTPGETPAVFTTKLGRLGIILCYDGDFPELSRVLTLKGAEVILRPSALMRSYEIWELTNMARAYDNHVYVVGVNAVGPDAGGNYFFGHSMIVNPLARKIALARGTEEIIAASLNPDPIKYISYGTRSPMLFDHVQDRNLQAYEGLLQPGKSPFEPYRRIPTSRSPPGDD